MLWQIVSWELPQDSFSSFSRDTKQPKINQKESVKLLGKVMNDFEHPAAIEESKALLNGFIPPSQAHLFLAFVIDRFGPDVAFEEAPALCVQVASTDQKTAVSMSRYIQTAPITTFVDSRTCSESNCDRLQIFVDRDCTTKLTDRLSGRFARWKEKIVTKSKHLTFMFHSDGSIVE
jgi:hypothetical protein